MENVNQQLVQLAVCLTLQVLSHRSSWRKRFQTLDRTVFKNLLSELELNLRQSIMIQSLAIDNIYNTHVL